MEFKANHYYALERRDSYAMCFEPEDVEGFILRYLIDGDVVLCKWVGKRRGGKRNWPGKWAQLTARLGDLQTILWMRVSRNNIGRGTWRELSGLEVLALADFLPTV